MLRLTASGGVTALDLLQHTLSDGFDGCGDLGSEANPGAEVASLDSVDHQTTWKLVQRTAELDRFGESESMGGTVESLGGQGSRSCVKAEDRTGACARRGCINQNHPNRVLPAFPQPRAFTAVLDNCYSARSAILQLARHQQADRVIRCVFVTDPDHDPVLRHRMSYQFARLECSKADSSLRSE